MATWLALLILLRANFVETFTPCTMDLHSQLWIDCASPSVRIFPSDTFFNWPITVLGKELRTWDCYEFKDNYIVIRARDNVTSNNQVHRVFKCLIYVVVERTSTMFAYDMSSINDGKRVELTTNSTPSSQSVCSGNAPPYLSDMSLWRPYRAYNSSNDKDAYCNGSVYHNNTANEQITIFPVESSSTLESHSTSPSYMTTSTVSSIFTSGISTGQTTETNIESTSPSSTTTVQMTTTGPLSTFSSNYSSSTTTYLTSINTDSQQSTESSTVTSTSTDTAQTTVTPLTVSSTDYVQSTLYSMSSSNTDAALSTVTSSRSTSTFAAESTVNNLYSTSTSSKPIIVSSSLSPVTTQSSTQSTVMNTSPSTSGSTRGTVPVSSNTPDNIKLTDSLAVTSTGITVGVFGASVIVVFVVASIAIVAYTAASDKKLKHLRISTSGSSREEFQHYYV